MIGFTGEMPDIRPDESGFAYWKRTGLIPLVAGAESNPPGGGQSGGEGTGSGGGGGKPDDKPAGGGGEGGGADDDDPATWDKDRAAKTIKEQREKEREARAEAARAKKELEAANKRLAEIDAANLSEKEKAEKAANDEKARADAAEAKLKEQTIQYKVQLAAAKEGAHDPDDVARMIDRDKIEYEDDGYTPKNIEKLVQELLKAKPYMKKGANGSNGHGNVPPSPKGANGAEIRKNWGHVHNETNRDSWFTCRVRELVSALYREKGIAPRPSKQVA